MGKRKPVELRETEDAGAHTRPDPWTYSVAEFKLDSRSEGVHDGHDGGPRPERCCRVSMQLVVGLQIVESAPVRDGAVQSHRHVPLRIRYGSSGPAHAGAEDRVRGVGQQQGHQLLVPRAIIRWNRRLVYR